MILLIINNIDFHDEIDAIFFYIKKPLQRYFTIVKTSNRRKQIH